MNYSRWRAMPCPDANRPWMVRAEDGRVHSAHEDYRKALRVSDKLNQDEQHAAIGWK